MPTRIISGIYLIRNTVNGKVYVGSTLSLEKRWSRHKTYLRRGDHHSSLLQRANAQVLEIKQLLISGTLSRPRIARMFNVSAPTVDRIKSGKNWGHVVPHIETR